MTATDDGGYVLACGTTTFDGYSGIIYLIKIDSSGNILWTSRYGEIADLRITSLCTTADHGFMIGGVSVGPNTSQYDIVAIKTDSLGKSICNMPDTGVAVTSAQVQVWSPSVTVTSGGVVTLTNFNTGPGGSVADLCINVGIHDAVKEKQISLYPNPFRDQLNITYTNTDGEVALFDFSGKEVLRQKTEEGNTIVQTSAIIPGFYILSYHEKGRLYHFKVIKF
jgi:WD40 repeat protein